MPTSSPGPSRAGYFVAACILAASLVGCAALIVLFVLTVVNIGGDFQRVVIPQGGDVTLNEPGRYTIYYEHRSEVGGQVFNTSQQLPSVTVTVQELNTPSAAPVVLSPVSGSTSYDTAFNRSGYAVWTFDVPQPGVYRVDGVYPNANEPPRVLAVGGGLGGTIARSVAYMFGGIFVGLAGAVLAIVLFVITLVRRQSAKRAAQATTP